METHWNKCFNAKETILKKTNVSFIIHFYLSKNNCNLDNFELTLWILEKLGFQLFDTMFANSLGNRGSILGWVVPKTQKMELSASLQYKVRIKGKWRNTEKGIAPSTTPWCSSYWKGNI